MEQETYDLDETAAQPAPGGEPAGPPLAKRPGCVTAYALLLGVAGTLHAGGVIFVIAVAVLTGDTAGLPVGVMAIQLALAGLELLIAGGLWRLRNWARRAVIVLQSLGIVLGLLGLVATLEEADPALTLGVLLIGVAISGYIIYWFASHGEYFD